MARHPPWQSFILIGVAGLHGLWLGYLWLYLGLGGDLKDLILLLLQLAALATAASLLLLLFAKRRIAWGVLALAWALSSALTVVDARQTAQEHQEFNRQMAPERLANNQRLLQSAVIKVPCAEGVTLTLNRRALSHGITVMSVSAVPADRTHQEDLLAVLSSDFPGRPILPDEHRRLKAYARQGPRVCRQGVETILQQLEAFSRIGAEP